MRMFQETDPERCVEHVIEQGIEVLGDASLLSLLLQNLLENAWKYTSKQAAARIQFGATSLCGIEVYYVKDNGAGFDMAHENKLFQPFERLHGSEFEGIGIGLATALQIVKRHGGKIWAEGRVDHGATVYFTLPAHFCSNRVVIPSVPRSDKNLHKMICRLSRFGVHLSPCPEELHI